MGRKSHGLLLNVVSFFVFHEAYWVAQLLVFVLGGVQLKLLLSQKCAAFKEKEE